MIPHERWSPYSHTANTRVYGAAASLRCSDTVIVVTGIVETFCSCSESGRRPKIFDIFHSSNQWWRHCQRLDLSILNSSYLICHHQINVRPDDSMLCSCRCTQRRCICCTWPPPPFPLYVSPLQLQLVRLVSNWGWSSHISLADRWPFWMTPLSSPVAVRSISKWQLAFGQSETVLRLHSRA